MNATPEQIAWAAGLFEGEGCMMPRGKTSAEMTLSMVDKDVVDRFHTIVACGTVYPNQHPARSGHQIQYRWSTGRAEDVQRLLMAFAPYMGLRRLARAHKTLDRIAECSGRERDADGLATRCRKGHLYAEVGAYIVKAKNGRSWRHCKACAAAYRGTESEKERIREANRAYREANREHLNAQKRALRAKEARDA